MCIIGVSQQISIPAEREAGMVSLPISSSSPRFVCRGLTGSGLAVMRHRAGWTQRELALLSGVHPQTVKYWERRAGPIAGVAPVRFLAALQTKGITLQSIASPENKAVSTAPTKCQAKTRKGTPCP